MHSKLEVSEVPSGLEVGLPPSQGTSNPSARRTVPSYTVPSTTQDGMSRYPLKDGNKYLSEAGGISKPRRNPWGLSPLMFGLLVALMTLIIVGAALGGGLGASLASAQKKNTTPIPSSTSSTTTASSTVSSTPTTSSATSTASTTAAAVIFSNYAVPRPTSTSDTVALNCPALDQKNYTTARNQNFLMSCNVGLTGFDLVGIAAYIIDDCIEACSSMNAFNGTNVCTAVTFNAAMYNNWNQHANCWLKTQEDITNTNGAGLLSAALQ